jgi:hypothetical protein
MSSEVAQLRERLQLEAASLYQGLYGYAEVAKHEIIQQRLQSFGETFEQLKDHLGEAEAASFMLTTLEQA